MPVDFKSVFLDMLLRPFGDRPIRLLDLGSGTSAPFPDVLRRYPNVEYTGVEPDDSARHAAAQLLAGIPGVRLEAALGESLTTRYRDVFDLTLSLSVLEHVKHLDEFLATSVSVTAPGGLVVHRYDLGHAIYPASWYERAAVYASRAVPRLVPVSRFTTYPDIERITRRLSVCGLSEVSVQQSQIHGLKLAMNHVSQIDPPLAARIVQMDGELSEMLGPRLPRSERDRLFPVITVRGRKR